MHKIICNLRKTLLHYIGHKLVVHKIFVIYVVAQARL